MSREIDVKDPSSWDDDDRTYLAERIDTVPVEHRADLMKTQQMTEPVAPPAVAEHPGITRLQNYVRINFPERSTEDPVQVVIDELGGDEIESAPDDEGDDYDEWKVAELEAEAIKRGLTVQRDGNKKAPFINALRDYDNSKHAGQA